MKNLVGVDVLRRHAHSVILRRSLATDVRISLQSVILNEVKNLWTIKFVDMPCLAQMSHIRST